MSMVMQQHSDFAAPARKHKPTSMGVCCSAAILHGVNDLRFETKTILPATCAPGQVRIAVQAVGICGSDVHYLHKGRIADFVVNSPMVIGHESAGVVVSVGEGVTALQPGDRVAMEPGIPCWHNRSAREGRYNLDPNIKFFATPPVDGSLSEYVDHPADFCYKLPDKLTLEEGAMCEPLSVGVHACRRAGVGAGKTVVILGCGPIGLVTLMAAKAFGADSVIMTDVNPDSCRVAQALGADSTVNHPPSMAPKEVAQLLKSQTLPYGPDVVIDCVGFPTTVQTAIHACASGGRICLVGMAADEMNIPMSMAIVKELDICGSFRYANTYPLCMKMMESGRVNVKPLITHRFPFTAEGVAAGFDVASRPAQTGAIKVMFDLSRLVPTGHPPPLALSAAAQDDDAGSDAGHSEMSVESYTGGMPVEL